jgi:hypothetical protein
MDAAGHSETTRLITSDDLGLIHTIRHVSFPSPFHLRSVRLVCVHTVRRGQSPSGIARDRRPAIISIIYAASFVL